MDLLREFDQRIAETRQKVIQRIKEIKEKDPESGLLLTYKEKLDQVVSIGAQKCDEIRECPYLGSSIKEYAYIGVVQLTIWALEELQNA